MSDTVRLWFIDPADVDFTYVMELRSTRGFLWERPYPEVVHHYETLGRQATGRPELRMIAAESNDRILWRTQDAGDTVTFSCPYCDFEDSVAAPPDTDLLVALLVALHELMIDHLVSNHRARRSKVDPKIQRVGLLQPGELLVITLPAGTDPARAAAVRSQLEHAGGLAGGRAVMLTEPVTLDKGATMTTYKRADGELIGEHGWVTDLKYFEDDYGPTELIEEHWVRLSTRQLTVNEREMED